MRTWRLDNCHVATRDVLESIVGNAPNIKAGTILKFVNKRPKIVVNIEQNVIDDIKIVRRMCVREGSRLECNASTESKVKNDLDLSLAMSGQSGPYGVE